MLEVVLKTPSLTLINKSSVIVMAFFIEAIAISQYKPEKI